MGCGGGGSDAATAGKVTVETGSLTKEEFARQADNSCEETRAAFERDYAAFRRREGLTSTEELSGSQTAYLVKTSIVPHYERLVEEISQLGAPQQDGQEVAAFLAALQRSLDFARRHPAGALATGTPFLEASELAREIGLEGCAFSLV